MSNFKDSKLKDALMKEAKANTPDLWNKIQVQLPSQEVTPLTLKTNKRKYIKAFSSIAAVLALVIGISVFIKKEIKPSDIASKDFEVIEIEKAPVSEDSLVAKKPVPYKDLNLAEGLTPAEKYNLNDEVYFSTLDIIPFSEELLSDTSWLGKVTILDAYYKDYKYDTFSDKFEPNGRLHNWIRTIVYEVKADEVYLEDGTIKAGDTFKIEQQCFNGCYLTDSALFDMKINHQYLLPLYYAGNTIIPEGYLEVHNYADGNIERDGQYSIIYPFAPQIEVTLDNKYIFHSEWKSLINDQSVNVIMPSYNSEEAFYADKMKLRSDTHFINDLKALINQYK